MVVWRQFDSVDIVLHDRLTVITGANGAGKSTLLQIFSRHLGFNRALLATPYFDSGGTYTYSPPSGTDKLMRLHAQTTYFENGRVHLRQGAPWLDEYVAELTGFPGCKFDDRVDSTTQFLDHHRHIPPPMRIHPDALRAAKRTTRWRRLL